MEFAASALKVGTQILVTKTNFFGGYREGDKGRVIEVVNGSGPRYYVCELNRPDKPDVLILHESEIRPRLARPRMSWLVAMSVN